jgi:pyrroline-5-carboxylate reductase
MPNTPALIGCGMSAFCGNRWVADADRELAQAILASLGRVLQVAEGELDAVTALSGSGPAYLFFLLEQMIGAGVAAGLSQETARILALQTVKGAAALMEAGGESPEALRRRVTSPGGTTEAALKVLEARGVGPALLEAIAAARRRSAELGAG